MNSRTVLGIQTPCDETSAAVVRDGALLSNVVASQQFHTRYGGIVPELASRSHQRLIVPVLDEALAKPGCATRDLGGVAAVHGPGLIGSLLVGLSFGKAYAYGLGIPFVGVNHMEAHIFSNLIDEPKPEFPFVNLTVSGGHTQLVVVKGLFQYDRLGEAPKKHFGTAKKATKLKSTAPHWCDGGQSAALTKLVRSTEDALTNIAWKVDKQVAVQILEKVYGKKSGAFIKIAPLREVDSGTNGIDRRPLRQENQEGRNLFGWQDPGRKGPGLQE